MAVALGVQVAAHASIHIRVQKSVGISGRAETVIEPLLSEDERNAEVSAMMGLSEDSGGSQSDNTKAAMHSLR